MQQSPPRRLTRSHDHRLAGVCGGIADYFNLDPTLVRVAFVVLALLGAGAGGLLLYLLLWVVMPPPAGAPAATPAPAREGRGRVEAGLVVGVILLGLGCSLLVRGMPMFWWFGGGLFHFSWPIVVILVGALLVVAARRR